MLRHMEEMEGEAMSDSPNMTPPPVPPAPPVMGAEPSSNAKLVALLAWIFAPLGVIAVFLEDFKRDPFVRSHAIQSAAVALALWIAGSLVITVTFGIAALFWWIVPLVVQVYYAIQAFNGKTVEVPVIYGFVKGLIDQV